MSEKVFIIIAVGITGTALTIARRWNSKEPYAGAGIAGWTSVAVILMGFLSLLITE